LTTKPQLKGPIDTHHAVHWNSVDPAYRDDWLTAAYASDVSKLIEASQSALWVHGHVHKSFDYRVGQPPHLL
jgi:Icc-related predicted phosphoesterase